MVLCSIWIFTDMIDTFQMFYLFLVISTVSSALLIQVWKIKFEMIMKLHEGNLKNNYQYTDFYLEQIAILCAESLKDEYSKFKVYEVMSYHKFFCHNSMCYCKYSTMMNQSNEFVVTEIYKYIDSIFQNCLQQKFVVDNIDEFEHLSLKYVSFLAKYRNNYPRAYFELKHLLSKRSNLTFYFKNISKILSRNVEFLSEQAHFKNNL